MLWFPSPPQLPPCAAPTFTASLPEPGAHTPSTPQFPHPVFCFTFSSCDLVTTCTLPTILSLLRGLLSLASLTSHLPDRSLTFSDHASLYFADSSTCAFLMLLFLGLLCSGLSSLLILNHFQGNRSICSSVLCTHMLICSFLSPAQTSLLSIRSHSQHLKLTKSDCTYIPAWLPENSSFSGSEHDRLEQWFLTSVGIRVSWEVCSVARLHPWGSESVGLGWGSENLSF